MYLRIRIQCPLCIGEPEWIYDTDTDQRHRGAMGCPGGCTAIQDIGIRQISEEDAKEFIEDERYPKIIWTCDCSNSSGLSHLCHLWRLALFSH